MAEDGNGLMIAEGVTGWSLNLSKPGQSLAEAQPGPHGLNQQEMAVLRLVEAYAAGPVVRSRAA